MLSKAVSSTISWVFGKTRSETESLSNTLVFRPKPTKNYILILGKHWCQHWISNICCLAWNLSTNHQHARMKHFSSLKNQCVFPSRELSFRLSVIIVATCFFVNFIWFVLFSYKKFHNRPLFKTETLGLILNCLKTNIFVRLKKTFAINQFQTLHLQKKILKKVILLFSKTFPIFIEWPL